MKRKETLIDLLSAEWHKSRALLSMQVWIDDGEYEDAMEMQFEYLYWCDEWVRLADKFGSKRWQLLLLVHGG